MPPRFLQRKYESEDITVSFDVARCIHAEECVRGLTTVFNREKVPWIQPDQASADQISEVIRSCPTGALRFRRTDGGEGESIPTANTVYPVPNGPNYLVGQIEIHTPEGEEVHRDTRLALCRCGASKIKPFCDNQHLEIGFEAQGGVQGDPELTAVEPRGKWVIRPYMDGPILLEGGFEIQNPDGNPVYRGKRAKLCRCGKSENKPFCDGTHRRVGFAAQSW